MDKLYRLDRDEPAALVRDAYEETDKGQEAILLVLDFKNTPIDILTNIGEEMVFLDSRAIAPKLAKHPNLSDETYENIMQRLQFLWWDDEPTAHRLAWEALQLHRKGCTCRGTRCECSTRCECQTLCHCDRPDDPATVY